MKTWTLAETSAGYAADWARMKIRSDAEIAAAARRIVAARRRYETVGRALGIPWAMIGVLHMREASNDFSCHLHNGDGLKRRTVHVPAGRLPTSEPPYSWEESAIDALKLDGLHRIGPWTIEAFAFAAERFNGFGPRNRGRKSGYLWAGSDVYDGGKYVADGKWSAETWDRQLGVMPVLRAIIDLCPGEAIVPGAAVLPVAPKLSDAVASSPAATRIAEVKTSAAGGSAVVAASTDGTARTLAIVAFVVVLAALAGLAGWAWCRRRRLAEAASAEVEEREPFETRAVVIPTEEK